MTLLLMRRTKLHKKSVIFCIKDYEHVVKRIIRVGIITYNR